MELGEKLRQARLEAGLSQRTLCGDVITRNMLSQIENGAARPSMDTLSYLAGQLGKPVSFFLEEDAVTSPNQALMTQGRKAYAQGDYAAVKALLKDYQTPDETFDWEKELLQWQATLALAEAALEEKRIPYMKRLLEELEGAVSSYVSTALKAKRAWLLAMAEPKEAKMEQLPDIDAVLLCKAEMAISHKNFSRAEAYLGAAEDRENTQWLRLRGEVYFAKEAYKQAAECFHKLEEREEQEVYLRLEQCYRALEDYKQAYFYACKQKK